ncbi:hypothetical protein D8L93_08050, partial [Sodalis-like symbiont of Bactericera trigonica]
MAKPVCSDYGNDRPLLLWHGEADPLVPPAERARLYQALRAREVHHQVRF